MMACGVRLMCIILICISLGAQCGIIFRNKHETKGASATRLPEPLLQIIETVKKTLINKSTNEEVSKMMKDHLMIMKLVNKDNIWAHEKLEKIGHTLLPGNLDGRDLCDLVDRMAQHAAKNHYLVDFLSQATETTYSQLQGLVHSEGPEGNTILPDVVAFAMVLDRLTSSQMEDWRVMQACQEIWDKELTKENILRIALELTPFTAAKAVTIAESVDRLLIALEKQERKEETARFLIPANILEAALEDFRLGFFANAKAGWILAHNQPGILEDGGKPGSDAIRFSEDGQAIEMHFHLGKEWADLYMTWNLAFVSHYPGFLYFSTKLLIPSVADYEAAPERFLHNRVFALHNFINWSLLGKIHDSFNISSTSSATKEVTQIWGKQNLKSSLDYMLRLTENPIHVLNIFKWPLYKMLL